MRRKLGMFALSMLILTFLLIVFIDFKYYVVIFCVLSAITVIFACKEHTPKWDDIYLPMLLGAIFAVVYIACFNIFTVFPIAKHENTSARIEATALQRGVCKDEYTSLDARVVRVRGEKADFNIALRINGSYDIAIGDTVKMFGEFKNPDDKYLPYLHAQNIHISFASRTDVEVITPQKFPLTLIPKAVGEAIREKFRALISSDDGFALLSALILGDKGDMSEELAVNLRRAGLSHVTAVSGLHISFIVGSLLLVFRRKIGMIVSVPAILFFVLMTGATPSIMRSAVMQLVWICSFWVEREADALTSLGLAAVCIICFNPYAVGDVGLWLSFGSTLGIVLWSHKICCVILRCFNRVHNKLLKAVIKNLSATAATSVASQVFILPITLFYFGEISLIAPIANLLLLGVIQVTFLGGLVLAPMAFTNFQYTGYIGSILEYIVNLEVQNVKILADLPFSYAALDRYIAASVITIYLVFGVYFCWRRTKRRMLLMTVCSIAILVCAAAYIMRSVESASTGYLIIPEMPGGQCIILTSQEQCAVINCGGYRSAYDCYELIRQQGARNIDLFVITDYNASSMLQAEALIGKIHTDLLVLPVPINEKSKEKARILGEYAIQCGTKIAFARGIAGDLHKTKYELGNITLNVVSNGMDGSDRERLAVFCSIEELEVLISGNISPSRLEKIIRTYYLHDIDVIALAPYYSSHILPKLITEGYEGVLVYSYYDDLLPTVRRSMSKSNALIYEARDYEKIIIRTCW